MPIIGGIDLVAGTIVAFGALLVYDAFFVTFDREVSLVWPSRWNLGKVLFFLNRYLPFVDTFLSLHLLLGKNTDRGCLLGFSVLTWLIVVGIIIAEVILMIRTYAIWERNRVIFFVLIFLGLGSFIPGIVVTQIEVMSFHYAAGRRGGCSHTKPPSPIIFVAFLLLIICETTIVVLTLVRARQHYVARQIRSPLIKQLYKDGLLYFVYLLAFSLVNLVIAVAAPVEYANWLTSPQRVMHSLLCTRVLLHIRSHYTSPDTDVMSTRVSMAFASSDAYEEGQGRSAISQGSGTASGSGSGSEAEARAFLSFSSPTTSTSPSEERSNLFKYKDVESPWHRRNVEEIELRPIQREAPQVRFNEIEEVSRPRRVGRGGDNG